MKRRRGDRSLREDEIVLWRQVAQNVRPLPGRRLPEAETAPQSENARENVRETSARVPLGPARENPKTPPLAPLERRLTMALRRGTEPVDAVIDLHGLRQAEAHAVLIGFLTRAQRQGARLVLVVTGKGSSTPEAIGLGEERGILRRIVPHWLAAAELRSVVLGFAEAARQHGGAGALYVRLRRRRDRDGG